jgi:hypothetical protein
MADTSNTGGVVRIDLMGMVASNLAAQDLAMEIATEIRIIRNYWPSRHNPPNGHASESWASLLTLTVLRLRQLTNRPSRRERAARGELFGVR